MAALATYVPVGLLSVDTGFCGRWSVGQISRYPNGFPRLGYGNAVKLKEYAAGLVPGGKQELSNTGKSRATPPDMCGEPNPCGNCELRVSAIRHGGNAWNCNVD